MNRICTTVMLMIPAALAAGASAAPLVRTGSGNSPAAVQAIVDQFRADLGGVNNGVGGSFPTGRREINWDAPALDAFAFPNNMPPDFFNRASAPGVVGSPRGATFSTDGEGFYVSKRDAANDLSNPLLRFGDINPQYNSIFQVFSQQRLFAPDGSTVTNVRFFVPGSPTTAATVAGFGAIFTDVDSDASTRIDYYDELDQLIFTQNVTPENNGLSFLGVSFTQGERIARVRIISGNAELNEFNNDGAVLGDEVLDVVAMDDFFYSEPQAIPAPGALALLGAAGAAAGRRRRR